VVEADAFTLIHQTESETCILKYTGPRNAIMSTVDDCVNSVNVEVHSLILAPPGVCLPPVKINEKTKYFALEHCSPRHQNDARDYIQIKRYNNNHLYCYGNNITIAGVEQASPNRTCVLP